MVLRGIQFICDVQDPESGLIGTRSGIHCVYNHAIAAVCRNLVGGVLGDLEAHEHAQGAGSQLLLRRLPNWSDTTECVDYYYWYFGTRAMRLHGGVDWGIWKSFTLSAVMENQKTEDCARGSWDPQKCPWGDSGGRIYDTAMMMLLLETAEDG